MSDIYLVMRRRLEAVTQWIELGSETIRDAREAQGLSIERAAHLVPVVEKTWRRWEAKGAVPATSVRRVAEILDLELENPRFGVSTLEASPESERLARLEGQVSELLLLVRALSERDNEAGSEAE